MSILRSSLAAIVLLAPCSRLPAQAQADADSEQQIRKKIAKIQAALNHSIKTDTFQETLPLQKFLDVLGKQLPKDKRIVFRVDVAASESTLALSLVAMKVSYMLPLERREVTMGLANARLLLKNPRRPELQPVEVEALADSGSLFLCIPPHVQVQLELEESGKKEITLADESKKSVPYVGPVEVHFKNRVGFVGAVVVGNEVLLGAIPMEDMDLVIIPRTRMVDVNPASPNFASGVVK
jgi:clan AA aspartic protease